MAADLTVSDGVADAGFIWDVSLWDGDDLYDGTAVTLTITDGLA